MKRSPNQPRPPSLPGPPTRQHLRSTPPTHRSLNPSGTATADRLFLPDRPAAGSRHTPTALPRSASPSPNRYRPGQPAVSSEPTPTSRGPRSLWATGPPGTALTPADLRLASLLMYYGGDAVEIALALLLASQWYRAQGRSLRSHRGTRQPAPA
ncbi:hypothetical protein GCM10010244_68890 [Streptomyces coeruleorubidus]|nr:hypothetical protein GCM10010244_68890 [Streptomyces bellus]